MSVMQQRAGGEPVHEGAAADRDDESSRASLLRPWALAARPDLASLAKEWVTLVGTSPDHATEGGATVTSIHQLRLQPVIQFVRQRLAERAALALEAGDDLTYRFTTWELDWIDNAWAEVAEHPHRLAEVERYLKRSAQRNRRHPEFDVEWRVSGW